MKRNAMVAAADHVSEWSLMSMRIFDSEFFPRWQKIELFELPFNEALANEMEWDLEFTRLASSEYKKFVFLSSRFPDRMVPSIHVDTVWHMHLLHTRSYQNFCREALGLEFLHHEPSNGSADEEFMYKSLYLTTLCVYEEFFGLPPLAIWGGDASEFRKRMEALICKPPHQET